ncbi:MAG: transcription elongation factor NusA [Nitrososphaerota archaeon]
MQAPICSFDAKNAVLCPKCESKLESGAITSFDVDAAIKLAQLGKKNKKIDKFSLSACKVIDGNYLLYLKEDDIMVIRQSRTLYRLIQSQFPGKVWLIETKASDKRLIEDLFFPTRVLSINEVWANHGSQKIKAVIAGKWTPKFPIKLEDTIEIVKNLRKQELVVEFEKARK